MTDVLAAIGSWPFVANIWFLTAVAAAALLAFLRHSPAARRFLRARDPASAPSQFEQFWSRRDGRALAVAWVVLVALTIGDFGLVWSDTWEPMRVFFAILQPVAGVLLAPMTGALYLYSGLSRRSRATSPTSASGRSRAASTGASTHSSSGPWSWRPACSSSIRRSAA